MRAAAVTFAALACACGPQLIDSGAGEETSSGGETSTSTTTSTTTSTSSSSSTSTSSSTTGVDSGSSSEDGGCQFICELDCPHCFGDPCDIWAEDCPRGEKCMPYANDGGSAWNDLKCVPIVPDPKQPGEPCTVEGSGLSGIDDCDIHSMCWGVDPETNEGTCIAMCSGSAENPYCSGECEVCPLAGDGVLALCLPGCDPLAPTCADGWVCFPWQDEFACAPDGSGPDLGAAGDPCEFSNACDPGLFCASAGVVPDCNGAAGCCAPFCDTSAVDPCPGADPGVECVPWWEPGQEPRDGCASAGVGACVLPQ